MLGSVGWNEVEKMNNKKKKYTFVMYGPGMPSVYNMYAGEL